MLQSETWLTHSRCGTSVQVRFALSGRHTPPRHSTVRLSCPLKIKVRE